MRRTLLLTAALLLTACGGGDDEKAAFVDAAGQVCEQAQEEFGALVVPSQPDGFAPYAEQVAGVVEKARAELVALEPPEGDRAELQDKVLDPLAALVKEGQEYATRIRDAGDDQAKLLTLLSQRPTAKDIDTEYLRSYGLDSCAEAIEAAG